MEKITPQQYCNKCQRFLADRYLYGICPMCKAPNCKGDQCDACGKLVDSIEMIDPRCKTCDSPASVKDTEHIYIKLPAMTEELGEWVGQASEKGGWSQNAKSFTGQLLKGGLVDRAITRDLKWGTPIPLEKYSHKVFYVWFDAPIGYISITANYTDEWKQWW
jgi:methionyl-tRNA synthetase